MEASVAAYFDTDDTFEHSGILWTSNGWCNYRWEGFILLHYRGYKVIWTFRWYLAGLGGGMKKATVAEWLLIPMLPLWSSSVLRGCFKKRNPGHRGWSYTDGIPIAYHSHWWSLPSNALSGLTVPRLSLQKRFPPRWKSSVLEKS